MFNGKEKKKKRFVTVYEQSIGMGGIQIIADTVTGVQYVNTIGSGYSGLTPLLDEEGKVVIDPKYVGNED